MPITLAQAKVLSQDKLTGMVIDEFRKSALLDMLTFDNTVKPSGGKTLAYVYDRITTQATAAVRAINAEFVPQEAVCTPITVALKIFGGSFQLDRVIANNETQVVDHVKFQTGEKTKAAIALFHDMFINGDSGSDPLQFDGIDKALTSSTTELIPGSAIALASSANLDSNWKVFLDAMRKLEATMDGEASLWQMNRDMFAVFQSVMDRAGINLTSKENFGKNVVQWGNATVMSLGDKPGTALPIISTTAGETSIYAMRLGLDAVHAVSPDGNKVAQVYLPNMTAPGAVKTGEVEMVAAMALKATKSAAVLRKVKIA